MDNRAFDVNNMKTLLNSPLYSHIVTRENDIVFNALKCFENECAVTLHVLQHSDMPRTSKIENIHLHVLKVLFCLGLAPFNAKFSLLVRLIEILAINRDITFEKAIELCAESQTNTATVTRAIKSEINMYNANFVESVEKLTDTSPLTPRDAIFDIAHLVRYKYFGNYILHA